MLKPRIPTSLHRYFSSSSEFIRLAVLVTISFPLGLQSEADLLFERGLDTCNETTRFWWNRFGPLHAADTWRKTASRMKGFRDWRWHLDDVSI